MAQIWDLIERRSGVSIRVRLFGVTLDGFVGKTSSWKKDSCFAITRIYTADETAKVAARGMYYAYTINP